MQPRSRLTGAPRPQQTKSLAENKENEDEDQNTIGNEKAVYDLAGHNNRDDTGKHNKGRQRR